MEPGEGVRRQLVEGSLDGIAKTRRHRRRVLIYEIVANLASDVVASAREDLDLHECFVARCAATILSVSARSSSQ